MRLGLVIANLNFQTIVGQVDEALSRMLIGGEQRDELAARTAAGMLVGNDAASNGRDPRLGRSSILRWEKIDQERPVGQRFEHAGRRAFFSRVITCRSSPWEIRSLHDVKRLKPRSANVRLWSPTDTHSSSAKSCSLVEYGPNAASTSIRVSKFMSAARRS